MTRNERQLKAVEQEMERHGTEADAILTSADKEDRETTPEEKSSVEDHLKAIKTLKETKSDLEEAIKVEGTVRELGKKIGSEEKSEKDHPQPKKVKSIGEQFVESAEFKAVQGKARSGKFDSGAVSVETKATLLEGVLGSPGAGATLIPEDRRPGVQQILFNRLTVAALLASGQTSSNVVTYVTESTASAGSIGTVAEGADKPEATLEFSSASVPVRKIASFLPVSDEMLEDAAQIQSYINARLSLFVQQEEEDQLLNAAGAGTDLNGLLNQVPAANKYQTSSTTHPNGADHIYAALSKARRSYLEPDGIVINPADWEDLRLVKDSTWNYIGGSPFSNTGSNPGESLFGKRVVVTEAIAEGIALVGSFGEAAQVFRRGGLTVEATNSHDDYFQKNLVAIRAEERLALAVYRPAAFATADLAHVS